MKKELQKRIYGAYFKSKGIPITEDGLEEAYNSVFCSGEVLGALITESKDKMREHLEDILVQHLHEMLENLGMPKGLVRSLEAFRLPESVCDTVEYDGKTYYIYTGYSY